MDAVLLFWFFVLLATAQGNFVAYTLTYNNPTCAGTPGMFGAFNQATCAPTACVTLGTTSHEAFCYAGTLASLANPVSCPGCAYCGWVQYSVGSNCQDGNNWTKTEFRRLGQCIAITGSTWIKAYQCTSEGKTDNVTQYGDAACTVALTPTISGQPQCLPNQPQCQSNGLPPVTSLVDDYCSYTGLPGGGPVVNGTTAPATASSLRTASLLLLGVLLWATL